MERDSLSTFPHFPLISSRMSKKMGMFSSQGHLQDMINMQTQIPVDL